MSMVFIFVPNSLLLSSKIVYLYGFIRSDNNATTFYILNAASKKESKEKCIGCCGKKSNIIKDNFININYNKPNDFIINYIKLNGEFVNLKLQIQIVCIYYDYNSFAKASLFDYPNSNLYLDDHFPTLTKAVKNHAYNATLKQKPSFVRSCCNSFFTRCLSFLFATIKFLLLVVHKMEPFLKHSAVGSHTINWLGELNNAVSNIKDNRKINVQTGNLLIAYIFDIFGGFLIIYLFSNWQNTIGSFIFDSAQTVVNSLRELLQWLMGSPAGLKLNHAFNDMLGNFFMYHITLWWGFLITAGPLLTQALGTLMWFGPLGITFLTAVTADLLSLATFHVYCIYVYAARLYNIQVNGLLALWRLFLGRKYNPLRGRVDSCHYSHRQLFVGTLAFTTLLFLLPTTFMYYTVFVTLRLCLLFLSSFLQKLRYMLQCLPIYITLLYLVKSPMIANSVHLEVCNERNNLENPLMLRVSLRAQSWWQIVTACFPQQKTNTTFGSIFHNVLSGNLM